MKINRFTRLMSWARGLVGSVEPSPALAFGPPEMMPGVVPDDEKIAMDSDMSDVYSYASQLYGTSYDHFPGYPVLAQLTQIAEYRMLSEKTAEAMVRRWIKLRSKSEDGDKTDRISQINDELARLNVRDLFQEVATHDGFFGRAQLFIDLGEQQDQAALERPLFKDAAIVKGKLRRLKLVEAMFTYPNAYSASNPLADDYYNPSTWFVMGKRVHSSRLLTFVGRPVPDILKPAYNFGGLSMSQLARPYVNNWIKTRDSVNRMISNYSTSGIKTNLDSVLSGGEGEEVLQRAQLYTEMRDNQGLMLLDNDQEEFFQFNTPLSGLDKLQAQAQEHMACPASMPLPVLTGITPSGLNASAEGDLQIWYDHVHGRQEKLFRPHLNTIIELIQLSKWGDVDPDITYDFVPLWEATEKEAGETRKSDAETAQMYVEMGALTAEEVRERLARDETSGYTIDLGIKVEEPDDAASAGQDDNA